MSDNLPEEIFVEILIRVPVKSLVRFTTVSKSWYSLITSPPFIATHLTKIQSQSDPTTLLLLRRYTKEDKMEHYTLHPDNKAAEDGDGNDPSVFSTTELDFPFKSKIGYFRIVGSCNGLLCLSDDLFRTTKPIILWNPSIRKSVNSPSPTINPPLPYMFVLGFGVNSAQDYKVVRIVYHEKRDFEFEVPPEVEVYSLSTGFWRRIMNVGIKCCVEDFSWSQAFVNGAVHWIGYDRHREDNGGFFRMLRLILAFDLNKEVFNEIILPDALSHEVVENFFITIYRDSLAVINYHRAVDNGTCSIWVMKEYGVSESWTRVYHFDLVEGMEKVVGFRKNGDILLCKEDNELVSYDPNTSVIKHLGISGSTRSWYATSFAETLILVERENGVLEEVHDVADAEALEEVNRDVNGSNEECN